MYRANDVSCTEIYFKSYIQNRLLSKSSSTNENSNEIMVKPVPGFSATKKRLNKRLDDAYFGTPDLRQQDVDDFVDMIMEPLTQTRIDTYLKSLSKKGNA